MNTFDIEKYFVVNDTNIDLSYLPMLLRRKLSRIDKLAFTVLSKIFDEEIDEAKELARTKRNGTS